MATNFKKDPLGAAERELTKLRSKIRQAKSNLSEVTADGSDGGANGTRLRKDIAELSAKEETYAVMYGLIRDGKQVKNDGDAIYRQALALDDASKAAYLGKSPVFASDSQQLDALGKPIAPVPASAAGSRAGEPLAGRQGADGKWMVVGTDSGNVFQAGLPDAAAAEAYINRQATGGTADAIGAFAEVPAGAAPKSGVLDAAGINYNGLTESEIKAAEATYLKSQNDDSLVDKVFNMQAITEEDTKFFLERAAQEQDPYYNQMFSRAGEDYVRSLEYQAKEREAQVAREKIDAAAALESAAAESADAGLATSGIRKKAEQRLSRQAMDIAASSRRRFEYDAATTGRTAEDYLGSSALAGLKLPDIAGAPVFAPSGNVRGSLERERESNKLIRAGELEADEIARRTETLAALGGTSTL